MSRKWSIVIGRKRITIEVTRAINKKRSMARREAGRRMSTERVMPADPFPADPFVARPAAKR